MAIRTQILTSYLVQKEYRFALDVESGMVSNNNKPQIQENFTRYPLRQPDSLLEGVPIVTEEQVWADKTIDAAFVEVTNCDLIPVAERVLAHGLPMHLDKPGGESYERYAKFRTIGTFLESAGK